MNPALAYPRTGKSISVSVAIALRACERAKLRARDDSSVARARRTNLWGPSIRPSSSVRAAVPIESSSFLDSDR